MCLCARVSEFVWLCAYLFLFAFVFSLCFDSPLVPVCLTVFFSMFLTLRGFVCLSFCVYFFPFV